jgi:hypothetical protein
MKASAHLLGTIEHMRGAGDTADDFRVPQGPEKCLKTGHSGLVQILGKKIHMMM